MRGGAGHPSRPPGAGHLASWPGRSDVAPRSHLSRKRRAGKHRGAI